MWDDEITVVALDFVLCVYWLGWIGKVHNARDIFFFLQILSEKSTCKTKKEITR